MISGRGGSSLKGQHVSSDAWKRRNGGLPAVSPRFIRRPEKPPNLFPTEAERLGFPAQIVILTKAERQQQASPRRRVPAAELLTEAERRLLRATAAQRTSMLTRESGVMSSHVLGAVGGAGGGRVLAGRADSGAPNAASMRSKLGSWRAAAAAAPQDAQQQRLQPAPPTAPAGSLRGGARVTPRAARVRRLEQQQRRTRVERARGAAQRAQAEADAKAEHEQQHRERAGRAAQARAERAAELSVQVARRRRRDRAATRHESEEREAYDGHLKRRQMLRAKGELARQTHIASGSWGGGGGDGSADMCLDDLTVLPGGTVYYQPVTNMTIQQRREQAAMLASRQDAIDQLDRMHGPKLWQQKSLPKTRHGKQAASEKEHAEMTAMELAEDTKYLEGAVKELKQVDNFALRMLSAAFGNAKSQVEFRHQIDPERRHEAALRDERGEDVATMDLASAGSWKSVRKSVETSPRGNATSVAGVAVAAVRVKKLGATSGVSMRERRLNAGFY